MDHEANRPQQRQQVRRPDDDDSLVRREGQQIRIGVEAADIAKSLGMKHTTNSGDGDTASQ